MHTITFLPHNKKITVPEGENLIRAAMAAGVHVNASCGGEGVCGKCRVLIESGEVAGGTTEKLSAQDLEKGYRLACLSTVQSDLVVRIPVESTIDASVLNMQSTPRRTAHIEHTDFYLLAADGRAVLRIILRRKRRPFIDVNLRR